MVKAYAVTLLLFRAVGWYLVGPSGGSWPCVAFRWQFKDLEGATYS